VVEDDGVEGAAAAQIELQTPVGAGGLDAGVGDHLDLHRRLKQTNKSESD
jgi:hypothetical protein